ncbi:MAG: SIS domain-containing protein [Candidatus Magasanikbacteria bacterium]|nr:SIS domain-containing protein [Candidatus Magasanikbacteria bacterium]
MLDDKAKISQLDSKNMLGSIELLGSQVEEVLAQAKQVKIPASYKKVNNIVVLGMGGSALGAHVLKSVSLKIPLEIINGYQAPAFVSSKSLVIASSYSGSTEEVLQAVKEAKKKQAKVMVICSGGQLAQWARKNKIPVLVFTVNNNPCGSPRMGLGYSIFGQAAMLANAGILKFSPAEVKSVLQNIAKYNSLFGVNNAEEKNTAKQMAGALFGKSVWYAASEHLSGNAHIAANQMNENAKRFGGYFLIPELNHHLMEGMLFPETNKNNIKFVLLESGLYDSRVQKRYEITKTILDKNGIEYVSYKCQEKTKSLQVCEVLMLGSYISFYSAMLQGIDPTAIPFVDFFKAELKR